MQLVRKILPKFRTTIQSMPKMQTKKMKEKTKIYCVACRAWITNCPHTSINEFEILEETRQEP